MSADVVELIELNVLAALEAISIAGGYDIPKDPELITRQPLMFDETSGLYPAYVIFVLGQPPDEYLELGSTLAESTLILQVQPYVSIPYPEDAPTIMNQYLRALRKALLTDKSRGGYAWLTRMAGVAPMTLWGGTGEVYVGGQEVEIKFLRIDEDDV